MPSAENSLIPLYAEAVVYCGYAFVFLRVSRLRWIALISWAVFYRFTKTSTRVFHFIPHIGKMSSFPPENLKKRAVKTIPG